VTALRPEVASQSTPTTDEPSEPVLAPRGPFQPQAITRSADHRYTYAGKTYPGVTSILKIIDKSDALMSWAARQTAEAAIGLGAEQLSRLLDNVGNEGTVKALTSRSSWKRDAAAQLGSDVHAIADRLIRGQDVVGIAENVRKHVEHYGDWWVTSGWTLRTSEAMLVHPTFGYGGTLDLLARDRDGRTVLADIKTGKGVYREAVLQLTAYGLAELIQTEAGIFTMPAVDRHVILHVTADGVREIEVPVGTLEKVAWGACLDLHQWAETTKGKRL
jgi:hypothetical protein